MEEILVQVDKAGQQIIDWSTESRGSGPTSGWPMADFRLAVYVIAAYLGFVVFGGLSMRFLPIPPLDKVTYPFRFVYNVVQMMLCSYMCIEAGLIAYRQGYSLTPCNAFNIESPPVGNVLWLFYISKILDFADTVFIVLGKKWRQLSFLHVYHHTTIFLFYWLNLNVGYDGDVYLTIVLNGFIHTIMYTYYFVALHTDNIWWKKYVTLSQMTQFACMITQGFWLLLSGCKTFPPRVTQVYVGYIVSLLILFMNFYLKTFKSKGAGRKGSKTGKNE